MALEKSKNIDKYLKSIYTNPEAPASFSGPKKLYDQSKKDGQNISLKDVKKWLKSQNVYTLFRETKKPLRNREVIVEGYLSHLETDLMDIRQYSKHNNNFNYVLCLLDTFSRYLWIKLLKNKRFTSMHKAFNALIKQIYHKNIKNIISLKSDRGSEYTSSKFKHYCKKNNIKQYFSTSDLQAHLVERVQKTIKRRIMKYMIENNTEKFIHILPKIVNSYNNTIHESLKQAPSEINKDNETMSRLTQYKIRQKKKQKIPPNLKKGYDFKIGSTVKIFLRSSKMDRAYWQKWSTENFIINQIFTIDKRLYFALIDAMHEPLTGLFEANELQLVNPNPKDQIYKIEKILTTKMINNIEYKLVKWFGFPKKYNSLIKSSDLLTL